MFREQENGFQTFDIPYLYQISAQSKQEKKAKKHLWTDSFQNEVLVYELFGEKKGIFYQFNSRFHENYTNLVLQVWFPIWLNDLLEKKHLQKTYQLSEHDATTISTNLLPITQSEKSVFRKEEKAKKNEEGKITIDPLKTNTKSSTSKVGEYIDFEELD